MLPSAAETSTISVPELFSLLSDAPQAGTETDGCPIVVDCREPDEHAICRISRAILIPLSTFVGEAAQRLPDKTRPIIVYCHHGMRSQRATAHLRRNGYGQAFSLHGGIDAWAEQVEPAMPRY